MKLPRHIIGYLICLLPFMTATAQPRLYFNQLTEKEGLVDSRITCFLQDHYGYIWIGTQMGISRYDGHTFHSINANPDHPNALKGKKIFRMAEDRQGKIWIATNIAGVNCYDPVKKRFSYLRANSGDHTKGLLSDDINEVYVDRANRVWIGYWGAGWTVYDQDRKLFQHYHVKGGDTNMYGQNMNNTIDGFAEDEQGNMWIISNRGVHCQELRTGHIISFYDINRDNNAVADNLFTCVYKANDSILYMGTWAAGIKQFNTRTKVFTPYLWEPINRIFGIHNIVLDIKPKSATECWVASADRGLGVFNRETGHFYFYEHRADDPHSVLPYECRQVFVDREGGLWAGFDVGISRGVLQSQYFTYHALQNPTSKEYKVHGIAFYKDTTRHLLYIGALGGGGLYIYDERKGQTTLIPFTGHLQHFAPGNYEIYGILPFDKDHLLLQAAGGIFLYDQQTHSLIKQEIPDQDGYRTYSGGGMVRDAAGYIWHGNVNLGIYRVAPGLDRATRYYKGAGSPVQFRDSHLTLLLVEGDTTAWIYETKTGLLHLDIKKNTLEKVPFVNHSDSEMVYKSMVRVNDSIYLAGGFNFGMQSLKRLQDGRFSCTWLGEKEGIAIDRVPDLTKDAGGYIWAATSKGPALLTGPNRFRIYNEVQGYIWGNVTTSLYGSDDGFIFVGVRGGYVQIDKTALLAPALPPKLVLQSLRIFDKEWNDTVDLNTIHHLELPYDQNFITATFTGIHFSNPESVHYQWMLEGLDKDWIEAENRNYISIAGLSSGAYKLRIRVAGSDGKWNNEEIQLGITIRPPFWKTWWFYLLITLAVLTIFYTVYRYRLKRIRQEVLLKNEFNKKIAESEMKALRAQMNPHFIFNSLNSINRYIVKSDPATASNYLTRFSKLIRLILDSSASSTTFLEQEIQLLKLYIEMESLRFEGRFNYDIAVDDALDPETTQIPSMVIQPFIENAIWHGLLHKEENGHLQIIFKKDKRVLRVIIEDDGVGRKKAAEMKSRNALKTKSYGMKISTDRIHIANTLYGIETKVNVEDLYNGDIATGTRITLEMPVDHA